MSPILVVEDERSLRVDLVDYLAAHGHEVTGLVCAAELRAALAARDEPGPAVVILDVGLPDGNGFDLATEIRAGRDCGIIMLTAYGEPEDRIRGFNSGADIYLVKHAPLREILAATESLLRRLEISPARAPAADVWSLDRTNWVLEAPDGTKVKLTATEYTFLLALSERPGEPCLREDLIERLARPQTSWSGRHLDAVVSRLRRKVAGHTETDFPVKMVYGKGYAFAAALRQS